MRHLAIGNGAHFVKRLAICIAVHGPNINSFVKPGVNDASSSGFWISDESILAAFPRRGFHAVPGRVPTRHATAADLVGFFAACRCPGYDGDSAARKLWADVLPGFWTPVGARCAQRASRKSQTPRSKRQRKLKIRNSIAVRHSPPLALWNFFGICRLAFGIS